MGRGPYRPVCVHTLHESSEHLAARLQQRVADDDAQELLEPCAPTLDNVVAEAVRKDLSGQRWDRDARRLALEDVAEVLKVRVPTPHAAHTQLEGGDVRPAHDLVVGVHVPADAMGTRVADLCRRGRDGVSAHMQALVLSRCPQTDLDL